ncbi:hypothetical protein KL942_003438 [Ogataea angusta]|uniref:Uncharacterized protein n=1 Tax=Pichia angusta TaxID=870730 RepID=A0ABQ7RWK0_PICAN|nr:hypothetical protein KL909_005384 [Ogataea angusta]KAG7826686.1 hypothetical protein KL920_005288 [Ogataea angusta]KAG7833468.1 hypothetical protein KL943_003576 [Ogataea angusta]KAG7839827.1 hypothetical protein KL942_003438 [Ogataea angusta]KAG7849460.1 hypothetical protein KL940_003142 [Ogataea angusta]
MEMQQAAQDRLVKTAVQVSFASAVASGSSYASEAYGGDGTYETHHGIFAYYNFRYPSPTRSIETFGKILGTLRRMTWTGEAEHLAVSVRSEGATNFNYDVDDEMKQAHRESLLDCDLHRAAIVGRKYFPTRLSSKIIGDDPGVDWTKVRLGSRG